ncbi:unnamed protein product [Parajaminaea phylloscopi]
MSSYQPFSLDANSPLAAALQASIQDALASRGFASHDDSILAEYILVMLANAKSKPQIDAELSELVGPDYNDEFTVWLWHEVARIEGHNGPSGSRPVEEQSIATELAEPVAVPPSVPPPVAERRRSASPHDRRRNNRSASPPGREASGAANGRASRHDVAQPRRGHSGAFRDRGQDDPRRERPPRELFASAMSSAAASSEGYSDHGSRSRLAMDDPSLHGDGSTSRALEIRGRASPHDRAASRQRRAADSDLFGTNTHTNGGNLPSQGRAPMSLLARAGIPDPRAMEFTPSSSNANVDAVPGSSLFSRMDPMIPDNLSATPTATQSSASGDSFPSRPEQTSLCRYSLSCTNPMCSYSHPSPSAAAAKRKGTMSDSDEPITTSEAPCRFGADCTNTQCGFSHVSPAVLFVRTRSSATAGASQSTPCRFGAHCTNPSCAFAHFDEQGKPAPSPALRRLLNQPTPTEGVQQSPTTSHTLGDDDIEIEVSTTEGPTERGTDGKPAALDRPLGDGATATNGVKPCKFGSGCIRADCWFSHPEWRKQPTAAASELASAGDGKPGSSATTQQNGHRLHISDRLSRFNQDGGNDAEAAERILPSA